MAPDKQLCANCSTLGNRAAPTCPAGAGYSLITEHGARTSLVGPGGHAAPLHLCPVPTGEPILIHTGQGQNLPPVLPPLCSGSLTQPWAQQEGWHNGTMLPPPGLPPPPQSRLSLSVSSPSLWRVAAIFHVFLISEIYEHNSILF